MTTDKTGALTAVADNPAARRYEISVYEAPHESSPDESAPVGTANGAGIVAGFTEYRDRTAAAETGGESRTERIFFHTEVDGAFGGRGLATILVREALDDARARGLVIVGVCPLVAAFLEKHPDYAEDSHPATPDVLAWLKKQG
ncbi:GNAT family N-acetyltransferase [Gordonia aurantiaca]|uniref:GNAT family N-acetyltransferase n=1 Tax=Gordonia sp. B21 TaxID=3151852 RepID=UPI003264F9F3